MGTTGTGKTEFIRLCTDGPKEDMDTELLSCMVLRLEINNQVDAE